MALINYDNGITDGALKHNVSRLTNQLWKLIPMREKNEDWHKQLETVIIEIAGLGTICGAIPQFLQILSKLEGLSIKGEDIGFDVYRKTVFESINLLQEVSHALRV